MGAGWAGGPGSLHAATGPGTGNVVIVQHTDPAAARQFFHSAAAAGASRLATRDGG
jgi:uncharacterized protein (DUF1330 family)